jgi:uncharacterized OsmC-like protein
MVRILATYQGEKHCELLHVPSKSRLETDAPVDNQGKGERFSPTDLVGSALVSCILTTMAIVAERDNVSIVGAEAEVEKVMSNNPRRIASLHVKIKLSKKIPADYRKKLENTAHQCPVHKSLHPEIEAPITFSYE